MYRKITAFIVLVCMLISLTVPCAYALSDDILATPLSVIALEDFSSGYAEVTAETTISSAYANGVISTGTGWKYLWSTTPDTYTAPVAADNINLYPLSLKKTSSSSNERFRVLKLNNLKKGTKAYRTLADDRVVKFDNIDAKYVFSVDVMDGNTSTGARYPLRYYIGDVFYIGYDRNDDGTKILPKIAFPGADGELNTEDDVVTSATTYITTAGGEGAGEYVHYEVTIDLAKDGNDVITLFVQDRQEYQHTFTTVSDESVTVTATADLTGKSAKYIAFGTIADKAAAFRVQNIKIEGVNYTLAEVSSLAQTIIDNGTGSKEDFKLIYDMFATEEIPDEAELTEQLRPIAISLGYNDVQYPSITAVTPDFTDGKAFAHEFEDTFDITYSYPLDGTGTVYIKDADGNIIAQSTEISGNTVTMSKTGEFNIGTTYTLTTEDAEDFKGDLIPDVEFSTVVVPTVNVVENGKYDIQKTITWEESGFDGVTATLKKPSGATVQIANNQTFTEAGEYILTITATMGTNTDDTVIEFEILPDYAPVASELEITGKAATGETLTGSYVYSDENKSDSESGTQLIWYRDDEKIGEGETYTLTEEDENSYITFAVIPSSDSEINPVGEEYKSEPFTGAFKPYVTDAVIAGTVSVGGALEVEYVYNDINGDAEGESVIRWYEFCDDGNVEITENISGGRLLVTDKLIGKIIYATVQPISINAPVMGDEAATPGFEVVTATAGDSTESGKFVSDFPEFEGEFAKDDVNLYAGLSQKTAFDDYTFARNEGEGFTINWSSKKNTYQAVSGTINTGFYEKTNGAWAMGYRNGMPIYRQLSSTLDMSNSGVYTVEYTGYEYSGNGNIGGSDHRIYLGSEDWYFGYKSGGVEGAYSYVPQLCLPGREDVLTGQGIAYESRTFKMRLDIVVKDDAEDEFKVKFWYTNTDEPEEYSIIATAELGDFKADYIGFTPTLATGGNGSRYFGYKGIFDNTGLKNEINSLADSESATAEELTQAFADLSKYPEGSTKNTIIEKLEALAGGVVTASVTECTPADGATVIAHETSKLEFKYNFMLGDGGSFVLSDEEGNAVDTTVQVKENKVTISIDEELENGRTYTVTPDGVTDYKGDAVPGISFNTHATPKINVTEGQRVSEKTILTWDDTTASDITVTLTTPSGETKTVENGYVLDEFGTHILVMEATANGITDTRTINFSVEEDIPPVAGNVRVTGLHETGALLTARYTYSDENGDAEGETIIKWYKCSDGTRTEIGTGATYILTQADEDYNIVAGVTPVAVSYGEPEGTETFSNEFTGAYTPVAGDVELSGRSRFGEELEISYVYYDKNGDAQTDTQIKWYLEDGTQITENITDNKLKITEALFEKTVYATVTPKSARAPFTGKTVKTEKLLMPSAPSVTDVVITGNAAVGGILVADYKFADPNYDAEGKSRYEWKNTSNGTVIGTARTLTVKDSMVGMTIAVTVTGVSEQVPEESAPVTSAPVKISAGTVTVGGSAGGGAVGGLGLSGSVSGSSSGGASGGASSGGASGGASATPVQPEGFEDINGHWAKAYIEKLEAAGIVAKDSKFRPDDSISRAELLAMLFRAAKEELSGYSNTFGDVNSDDWFAEYVQTALDKGIISADETFRPYDAVTREEAAKIVANMLELATDIKAEFADNSEISEWAADFVNAVAAVGIFKGDENGNFNPKGRLTRAETATVISRLLDAGSFDAEEEAAEETDENTEEEVL